MPSFVSQVLRAASHSNDASSQVIPSSLKWSEPSMAGPDSGW